MTDQNVPLLSESYITKLTDAKARPRTTAGWCSQRAQSVRTHPTVNVLLEPKHFHFIFIFQYFLQPWRELQQASAVPSIGL